MLRFALATTRVAAIRVRKGTRLSLPSCSALRCELLQRLGGGIPEAHSTAGVPAGLRSIQLPLEPSEQPPQSSPSERRRLRKAERRARRDEAKRKARLLAAEATALRMAARQALLDAMSAEARAHLAASPWLPTFLTHAFVRALRASPSPSPGPTQEVVAFLAAERQKRWRDNPRERVCRVEQEARVAHAFARASRVAIDLSFASTLSEVEQRSLWRQLQVCYGANRRAAAPLSLHLTSLAGCPSEGIELGWPPDRPPPSSAVERVRALGWTVGVHEGAVTEHFDPSSVVYLSPDADTVLDKLQGDTVYVLGGLVDRSVRRGASLSRAAQLGVRTARLPLQVRSRLRPHLRPCPPQHPRLCPPPRPPRAHTFTFTFPLAQEHAPSVLNGRLPLTLNAVR